MHGEQTESNRQDVARSGIELLTPKEFAERLRVPVTWVRDQTRTRASCGDMIPHLRLGRYVRFAWGSPELEAWIQRRVVAKSLPTM